MLGLKINFHKSELMLFGKAAEKREIYQEIFTCVIGKMPIKYLGLPVHVGKSKRKAFAYVKGGITGRVYGWKEKLIAKSGKDTLVKGWPKQYPPLPCLVLT